MTLTNRIRTLSAAVVAVTALSAGASPAATGSPPAAASPSVAEPGSMRAAYATTYGRVTLVGNYNPSVRHLITPKLRIRVARRGSKAVTLALPFKTIGKMAPAYYGATFPGARPWFFVAGRHVIFSAPLHSGVRDLPFETPAPVGSTQRYGLRVVNIYRVVLRGSTPFKVVLVTQYTAATPFPAAAFEEDVR